MGLIPIFCLSLNSHHNRLISTAGSGSSVPSASANPASHQRALSLPITSPILHHSPSTAINTGHHLSMSLSTTTLLPPSDYVESAPPPPSPLDTTPPPSAITTTTTSYTIQPFHQRTRSLPLTEETAIQITSYHSNVPIVEHNGHGVSNAALGTADNCHCNSQPCRHPNHNHSVHPTTTISHFYNRHNQKHFELLNDHHHMNIDSPAVAAINRLNNNTIGSEQTVPTMTSSMDSIVEDDDCSTSGDYTNENSVVNQLLSSMGAGGNDEMLRLIATNRLGSNARSNGTSSVAAASVGTVSGGGVHQSSRSTYFKRFTILYAFTHDTRLILTHKLFLVWFLLTVHLYIVSLSTSSSHYAARMPMSYAKHTDTHIHY